MDVVGEVLECINKDRVIEKLNPLKNEMGRRSNILPTGLALARL